MQERVQYSRDGRCRQNLLNKIVKVRSWSSGVIKTVAGPKKEQDENEWTGGKREGRGG